MSPNDSQLIFELKRDEGVRYEPYFDTEGIETVGVGHNLKASPISATYPLTDEQVDSILARDLISVFMALDKNIGWWRTLSYARQRVMVNMCFNLGIAGLLKFKNTLAAIERGNYAEAAEQMLKSKWAEQVGQRAKRLSGLMVMG